MSNSSDQNEKGPRGWLILICGSSELRDHAMIGDFAGLMYHLRNDFGIYKDFITSVDLREYVTETRYQDIKFGRGKDAITVYSRFHAENRKPPFTYVPPRNLQAWFEAWIEKVSALAKGGDTVNILIVSHGSISGEINMGDKLVETSEMERLMRKFKQGVEVNYLTNACWGGIICDTIRSSDQTWRYIQSACGNEEKSWAAGRVGNTQHGRSVSDRYRDFYFTEALVSSLLKIGNKSTQKGIAAHTMAEHFNQLRSGTWNNAPQNYKSTPKAHTDWFLGNTLFQVLHLDFVKATHKDKQQSVNQRLILPNAKVLSDRRPPRQVPLDPASGSLLEILAEETAKVSEADCGVQDQTLWCSMDDLVNRRDIPTQESVGSLFRKLYWRVGVQETFFDALMFLNGQLLVDLSGFKTPMDLDTVRSKEVLRVYAALRAFQYVRATAISGYTSGFYETPAIWFATMLVRGAMVDDLDLMVQRLLMEGFFGNLDEEKYRQKWPETTKLVRDPSCGAIAKSWGSFCGWLIPRQIRSNDPDEIFNLATSSVYRSIRVFDEAWDAYRAKLMQGPSSSICDSNNR